MGKLKIKKGKKKVKKTIRTCTKTKEKKEKVIASSKTLSMKSMKKTSPSQEKNEILLNYKNFDERMKGRTQRKKNYNAVPFTIAPPSFTFESSSSKSTPADPLQDFFSPLQQDEEAKSTINKRKHKPDEATKISIFPNRFSLLQEEDDEEENEKEKKKSVLSFVIKPPSFAMPVENQTLIDPDL